ncbi:hypothetical protein FGL86_17455 [Pistricoccus aurantiacus]|uniref:Uncharacterized protein n=1 Tax=Pistricoccus aurantiacus TaxID=1883414 RepID=A0A5B8SYT3_9GAMM|nr:hypothetical protein [Pistricoccus aurantiacus]QEA40685.1 hypothetical protein FGL86_17455 [Pistricoccus aurantiacus]
MVVCSRFVDEYGNHRTNELEKIFRTESIEGKFALLHSLEYMQNWVGGMDGYKRQYPVTIIPKRPAFPQLKIVGIESLAKQIYRVLDSNSTAYPSDELIKDYIMRTGRLPAVPKQRRPVRRTKPRYHWCSYEKWEDPESTRDALQILPKWSDCRLRATVLTSNISRSAYVAFNGDKNDPSDASLRFYKYYYEPLAQDHPPLGGGGPQIALEGEPRVEVLEQWDELDCKWQMIWAA